jgi:hypothetical protein
MPWSRAERVLVAVFALVVIASLPLLVHPWYDPMNDAAIYLWTAKALAAGDGYTFLGTPFVMRPPGFPLLLSPIVALRGFDFHALNLFVASWGVLTLLLLHLVLRTRLGWAASLCLCALLWLNPGYQTLCNQVMSDHPGLALLLCALLADRACARTPSLRRELLLGVVIGLSTYVRSANALLVPAILCSRVLERVLGGEGRLPWARFALRRLAPVALAAWLVALPWSLRNASVDLPVPVDQLENHTYATAMWHVDPGDPRSPGVTWDDWRERFRVRAPQVVAAVGSRTTTKEYTPALAVPAALIAGALLIGLVRRRAPIEIYLCAHAVILVFYFGFGWRLLLPVWVFALADGVDCLRALAGRLFGTRGATALACAGLLALALVDAEPRRDWERIRKGHERHGAVARAIEGEIAPDARLAAMRGYSYSVYLERPVWSLEFAVERERSFLAAEALIDREGIDTLVASPLGQYDGQLRAYLERRYPGALRRAGEVIVAHVRGRAGEPR